MRNTKHGGAMRRRFLFKLPAIPLLAGLITLLPGRAMAATPSRAQAARPQLVTPTLTAFLDTLLPRDVQSGAASDLGVPQAVLAEAARNALYGRLVDIGCRWLDQAAEGRFADAAPEVQQLIVAWAAQSDWNQVPRRFYELVRQHALEVYYSQPAAWGGLPVSRPPQPLGYPEPWA